MKRSKLLQLRKKKGYTQEEIADISGVNRSYYSLIELGLRDPTLKVAICISNALEVALEQAFEEEIFFGNKSYNMKQ